MNFGCLLSKRHTKGCFTMNRMKETCTWLLQLVFSCVFKHMCLSYHDISFIYWKHHVLPIFFSGFYSIGGRKIYALRSPSDARTTIYFASGELRQRAPSAEWFGMGWKVWSLSSLYFRMGFGGWIWTKYHVHLNTEVISCAYINNIK